MKKTMEFIMKYKLIVLSLLIVLTIILMALLILEISKTADVNKKENKLKEQFETFIVYLKSGESFDANMMFELNSKNEKSPTYKKEAELNELLNAGYITYIQSTEYKLDYYKKFDVEILKIKNIDDQAATLTVRAKRPDYIKHSNDCDIENIDNPNYNFSQAFIEKINSDKAIYITDDYDIDFVKVNDVWKIIYSEQTKEMLYGKSSEPEEINDETYYEEYN